MIQMEWFDIYYEPYFVFNLISPTLVHINFVFVQDRKVFTCIWASLCAQLAFCGTVSFKLGHTSTQAHSSQRPQILWNIMWGIW